LRSSKWQFGVKDASLGEWWSDLNGFLQMEGDFSPSSLRKNLEVGPLFAVS
jgi:hypothetical protein